MFGVVGLRHENLDVAANHFRFEIAELPDRCGIERNNRSVWLDHHGCVEHRIQNRAQVRFAGHQGRLGLVDGDPGAVQQFADPGNCSADNREQQQLRWHVAVQPADMVGAEQGKNGRKQAGSGAADDGNEQDRGHEQHDAGMVRQPPVQRQQDGESCANGDSGQRIAGPALKLA